MDAIKLMESYALVVKLGSFTRAAHELGATRAMISKRVKELEASLGIKLLTRNTHGLSVTTAGSEYYEECVPLLAGIRALNDRMQDRRTALRGEIKLFSNKTFSETLLGPIVSEFCLRHPDVSVQLDVVGRDAESYEAHFISGGYDMAVLSKPVRNSPFVTRSLGRLPQVLVASPDYLRRCGVPRSPNDLATHNCLDPSGAPVSIWELRGPAGRSSVRVSGRLRTNGTLIVRHAAVEGLGIAVLREYLVAGQLRDGSLVRVLPEYAADERQIYLLYQKDSYRPMRIKAFSAYLTQRFAEIAEMSNTSGEASRPPARTPRAATKPGRRVPAQRRG